MGPGDIGFQHPWERGRKYRGKESDLSNSAGTQSLELVPRIREESGQGSWDIGCWDIGLLVFKFLPYKN